jgi:hypothetical protein
MSFLQNYNERTGTFRTIFEKISSASLSASNGERAGLRCRINAKGLNHERTPMHTSI